MKTVNQTGYLIRKKLPDGTYDYQGKQSRRHAEVAFKTFEQANEVRLHGSNRGSYYSRHAACPDADIVVVNTCHVLGVVRLVLSEA